MNKKYLTALILFLIFSTAIYIYAKQIYNNTDTNYTTDVPSNTATPDVKPSMGDSPTSQSKRYVTNLKDVTDGKTIRFTEFSGNSSGRVEVNYSEDSGYVLDATFNNLPQPAAEHFYEGWIVTSGENIDVLSTGEVVLNNNGSFINTFTSDKDLTDHTFYVLTIEPRDNNPRPEQHILEGILVMQVN